MGRDHDIQGIELQGTRAGARRLPLVTFAIGLTFWAFAGLAASDARAEDRWVAPAGAGAWPCVQSAPCSLLTAVDNFGLQAGDHILLGGGTYNVGASTVTVDVPVVVRPAPGAGRPVISGSSEDPVVRLWSTPPATLKGINVIQGGEGWALDTQAQSVFDGVYAISNGWTARIGSDSIARNSVFVSTGTSDRTLLPATTGAHFSNVTAIATGNASIALSLVGSYLIDSGQVTAVNSVFRAGDDTSSYDILVTGGSSDGGLQVANSAFRTGHLGTDGPYTFASLGGQIDDDITPLLLGDAASYFRPATGSPLINAGTVSPSRLFGKGLGATDILGVARLQGGKPDIGAHERAVRPKLSTKARSKSGGKKIKFRVRCDEACRVSISGGVKSKTLKNLKANKWKSVALKVKVKTAKAKVKFKARDTDRQTRTKRIKVKL